MGFLEKIGLVEAIEPEVSTYDAVDLTTDKEEETPLPVELECVWCDTLLDDIYAESGLSDTSRSIFKVEELIESLPKEMTTEVKRNSVLAILGSFNLTATDVMADGEKRVGVLSATKDKIIADSNNVVAEKEAEIEELKKKIEILSSEIFSEQQNSKLCCEAVSTEITRVSSLIKFAGGVN